MVTKEIWFQQSAIKRSRHSKKMEWEKIIWHHSFYPQPTSGPQSYEEHCLWTLRSAAWHSCLPPQDQLSLWWQRCQVKSVLRVASPATRTSSLCYGQEANPLLRGEGSRRATGQWHFGYPLQDSCTTLDPASSCTRGQQRRGLVAWDKDAERAWAVIPAGISGSSPALCMKSSS